MLNGVHVDRGEANMLKILPIILFHSAHKLSQLFLCSIDYSIFSVDITRYFINNIIQINVR